MKTWKGDQCYIQRRKTVIVIICIICWCNFRSWYENTDITSCLLIQVSPSAYVLCSTICLYVQFKRVPISTSDPPRTAIATLLEQHSNLLNLCTSWFFLIRLFCLLTYISFHVLRKDCTTSFYPSFAGNNNQVVNISKRCYRRQGTYMFSSSAPMIYTGIQTHWKSPYLDVVIHEKRTR